MSHSPLEWLVAHLERRPGVTVRSNRTLVHAQMRGRQPVYVRWSSAKEAFFWWSGSNHDELLMADPALVAEQVMMRLEAPPEPWPEAKPWWAYVR